MEEGTRRGSRCLLLEGAKIAGQAGDKCRKPQDCKEEENGPSSLGSLVSRVPPFTQLLPISSQAGGD